MCIPKELNKLLSEYEYFFSKPQIIHFKTLITGLIVSENKTIQEINDGFGKKNQSSLNRFVTKSEFDLDELNNLRISQAKKHLNLDKFGIQIIDESLLHKTGEKMELIGRHRSGVTKRIELGHMIVNSLYTDKLQNTFPIKTDVYVQEKNCPKYNLDFKTKRQLAVEQIDYALANDLPIKLVIVDAGYEGEEFTQEILARGLDFMIGCRISTKISINRKKRSSIENYLDSLTDDNFKIHFKDDKAFFYHIATVSIRGIGKVKLIISYKYEDEENIKCYITNLNLPEEQIIDLLSMRWLIECFHRDGKQHLGLEAYQVRKGRGMQVVALAILIAYTLTVLAARILFTPLRKLRTVGEVCRYFALIAYKGSRWFLAKMANPIQFILLLKKHVFVKSAKV
jgi:SRSO17 transposase